MRRFIFVTIAIISFSGFYAQNSGGANRVRAAKVKFFNEKLELTSSESEKFWPIYNDYQSRKSKLASERKSMMRFYTENQSNMSAEEITQTLNRYIEIEKEETELLERYNNKFKQVLANEKVLKIYITEVQFRNYLLKQLRTRQQGMKPRN
ncbi:MAG TPA: hypothetical protein DDX98_01085 [Bacteroidales bacterium]|nr:hypothetical protein [Bacteroidales bacterium]